VHAHARRPHDAKSLRQAKKIGRSFKGAAKFREETPRKGGGFAVRDRNAALQQYAELGAGWQAQNTLCQTFLRGNSEKIQQQP
jgi:hypothetical protein